MVVYFSTLVVCCGNVRWDSTADSLRTPSVCKKGFGCGGRLVPPFPTNFVERAEEVRDTSVEQLRIGGATFIYSLSSPVTCNISPSVTTSVFCGQETAKLFGCRDSDRWLLYSNTQIFPERRIVSVQIHPRNQC